MKDIINKDIPAKEILEFRDKRGWNKHHTPSNLVKSISIEAAELLELYQWGGKKPIILIELKKNWPIY
jgi:NTP pyrophosphatase (non-canonical NTP hydrolase)